MDRIASLYFGFPEIPARAIIPVSPTACIQPVAGWSFGWASSQSAAFSMEARMANGEGAPAAGSAAAGRDNRTRDVRQEPIVRRMRGRKGWGIFKQAGAVDRR